MPVADDESPFQSAPWPTESPDGPQPDNVFVLPNANAVEVSEDAIALEFTREHKSNLKFDHDAGKWFQWSQTHWRMLSIPVAFHYARVLGRKLGAGKKTVCKSSVAGGAERFARADPAHAVTADIWDNDPWSLGTSGGTLNLKTGKMRQSSQADHITKLTGCEPDSKPPTLWLKFLHDSTRGDDQMITYLQRVAGYCLTGLTTEHALFFIYGSGGNGKSVFLNTLVYILGDYAINAPMDTFTSSKFSSHPTELAMLKGARLVTASETEEGRAWAESRIKGLTGGDPISARFMRQDFFTYQPQFKLLFAGNHQPTLNSVDPAMRRRFNMLPFIHKPEAPDHMLEEKLRAEAPRILAWALRGCLDWQKAGLGRPESVSVATDEYFDEQDVFGQWIEENCDTGPRMHDPAANLFADWKRYAKTAGEDPGAQIAFSKRLQKIGMKRGRMAGGVRKFDGLSLKIKTSDGERYES